MKITSLEKAQEDTRAIIGTSFTVSSKKDMNYLIAKVHLYLQRLKRLGEIARKA